MRNTTRMLEWISFFEKIRIDRTSAAENQPEKILTGDEVYNKLSPSWKPIFVDQKKLDATQFKEFDISDTPSVDDRRISSEYKDENELVDGLAIYLECTDGMDFPENSSGFPNAYTPAVLYLALKSAFTASKPGLFRYQFEEMKKTLNQNTEKNIEKLANYFSDATHKLQVADNDLRSTISKELQYEKDKIIEVATNEINKYKREAGATLVVKDADKLWRDKANLHRWFFGAAAVIFVFLVTAAIAFPIMYWPLISKEILKLEPLFTGHLLGAVVILLIPVLGVAWVLRLLSRFTTQNMMLADDAQLRRVMAETYVKLVSEDAIKEPQDRAIILTALFRPLPGTTNEEVSPPSITDIIKPK